MFHIEPTLFEVRFSDLHPTQIGVGLAEVEHKRQEWRALKKGPRAEAMRNQLFPVVRGPAQRRYVIDHHHIALSLQLEGAGSSWAGMVKDLSDLDEAAFWTYLDHMSWMHCYDEGGKLQTHREIPARFKDMKDDPYRSLAGAVRDAGGFSKPDEPFRLFLWANFFRERIDAGLLKHDLDKAIRRGLRIARTSEAAHLPGWSGKK